MKFYLIFSTILFITFAVCFGQKSGKSFYWIEISVHYKLPFAYLIAEYDAHFDETVSLLEELETVFPEAKAEIAAMIPAIRIRQRSSNTNDIPLAVKGLELLAPRILACMIMTSEYGSVCCIITFELQIYSLTPFNFTVVPKYYAYPKLQLLLSYAGALLVKDKYLLVEGFGTIHDVDASSKDFDELLRDAVADLRSTKGTCLNMNSIYNSVVYFKNVCQREICSN